MEQNATTPTPTRRAGRPRAIPALRPEADTREAILEAAGRLFTTRGYSASTTRQIADAVGLRQASIFHYFARKEDMLAELLDRTVEPALQYAHALRDAGGPPDAALYLLVINDLRSFCGHAVKLGWLYIQPDARAERFQEFWDKRERLRCAYEDLIRRGVTEGVFETDDIVLSTSVVFGIVESVTTWFEDDGSTPAAAVWEAVARRALRMLLADPAGVDALEAAAWSLEQRLAPPG